MTVGDGHAGGANGQPVAPVTVPPPTGPLTRPPKPHFALTVGIVGHRLKQWQIKDAAGRPLPQLDLETVHKVERDIHLALEAIKGAAALAHQKQQHAAHEALFAPHEPVLTLVSALADGADTLAAKAALALGYRLDAPLPFARADYRNDFDTVAVDAHWTVAQQEFDALLLQARAVLELPGRRKAAEDSQEQGLLKVNRAYEAAGLTVLSQADILLAVWDRGLSRGRGGTAEMIAEAARIGLPIILVDANGERPIELRWRGLMPTPAPIVALDDVQGTSLTERIQRVVDELVRPPQVAEQRNSLDDWYRESLCSTNIAVPYPMLMIWFGRKPRWYDVRPRSPAALAEFYVNDARPAIDGNAPGPIAWLAAGYGWADAVAIYCAQFFRSAFIVNFLFAAFAVIVASASVMLMKADSWHRHFPVVVEIILIVCVVANTMLGRKLRWHHRWVEGRELAERLRAALPLWTLGLRPASFAGEEPTWIGWYTRALVRMQGLRCADLSSGGLDTERSVLMKLLTDQCSYNHSNERQMHRAERGLEVAGMCLLFLTVAVALDHICDGPVIDWLLGRWLPGHEASIWLSAALPALATASYGIRVIGDFEGTRQRAERTSKKLDELVCAVRQDPVDFGLLRARARTAADALLGDVSSWRLSAESRGLAIPG